MSDDDILFLFRPLWDDLLKEDQFDVRKPGVVQPLEGEVA
jgi:hypothetical protein